MRVFGKLGFKRRACSPGMIQARGEVVLFDESMGNGCFVSHQWTARHHPDPESKQLRVLQEALKHLLSTQGSVSLDFATESFVPSAKSLPLQEFQSRPLFIWYDYFSVPQLHEPPPQPVECGESNKQGQAIRSIPTYVSKCRFFFALCPTMDCSVEVGVLNASAWARRGWCRVERAARELSEHGSWILIQSSTCIELVGTALSFVSGSVGEGEFTVEADRKRLGPVIREVVKRRLILSLRAGDLPCYRRHLNLQAVHFRGLDVVPVTHDFFPDEEPTTLDDIVAQFLHQNGLADVSSRDAAGWRPLHYAAMSGNVPVMEGLLLQRADPNSRTKKDEPSLGFPAWMSPLHLAVFYRHVEAARVLIAAGAKPEGGAFPPMSFAAMSNNVEGIRLLCEAKGNPTGKNIVGIPSTRVAAYFGAVSALEEMLSHGNPGPVELAVVLRNAMLRPGGSARMVQLLVDLKADIDVPFDLRRDLNGIGRLLNEVKSLQHRYGKTTVMTEQCHHAHGTTPLMAAILSGQFEGAAALIAAGARLDLKNCRGWTAADFARSQWIPEFLQRGLEGDPSECIRVTSLAMYIEI